MIPLDWNGVVSALKNVNIWLVSFNIFFVYSVYCGLTYFIPFLEEAYALPAALVGVYGIINQYGLKMLGSPVGGFLLSCFIVNRIKKQKG